MSISPRCEVGLGFVPEISCAQLKWMDLSHFYYSHWLVSVGVHAFDTMCRAHHHGLLSNRGWAPVIGPLFKTDDSSVVVPAAEPCVSSSCFIYSLGLARVILTLAQLVFRDGQYWRSSIWHYLWCQQIRYSAWLFVLPFNITQNIHWLLSFYFENLFLYCSYCVVANCLGFGVLIKQ